MKARKFVAVLTLVLVLEPGSPVEVKNMVTPHRRTLAPAPAAIQLLVHLWEENCWDYYEVDLDFRYQIAEMG